MKTILVINALNGTFPLVLRKKYPTAKITCAEVFPFYKHHLQNLGFEVVDWEGLTNVKFDVIVGNPPYQDNMENGDRKSLSTNLWSKFIDKCANELLKPDGHLSFVVPASWAGPTKNLSGNRRILKDILAVNNTTCICLDSDLNRYFGGVGSTFSWFHMQKGEYQGQTDVWFNKCDKVTVNLSEYESLPRVNHKLAYSINKKYFAKVKGDVIAGQYRTCDDQYQEMKTRTYKYPAYHTPADGGRIWYMKEEHPNFKKRKIIISLSGKYKPYPDSGKIGYTDMCLAYILKKGEKLDSAMSVFDSKLFHFIMDSNKWSGFNNKQVIRTFALPPLDRVYSDQDLFDWFGLTSEEAEFLASYKESL